MKPPCSARQLAAPAGKKFHGLTDLETRYRQRYVDLIINPEVRRTFESLKFISYVRRFLDGRGYMEWNPGAQHHLRRRHSPPLCHHHNTLDIAMYMRIATGCT